MAVRPNAPTIIKRKKVIVAGGHHGGAWKVAYADFVTAMMAFFLLMWLLNATTEEQRKGLADYFAPTIPLARVSGGSDGMFGGESMNSADTQQTDGSITAMVVGAKPEDEEEDQHEAEAEAAKAAEIAALRALEEELLGQSGESDVSDLALQHVVTRLTDDGLIIEIFALPGAPLFDGGSADPLPVTRDLVAMIGRLADIVTNPVAVAGHVPARSILFIDNPVWDLSTTRAGAVRVMLEQAGLDPARMRRVTGHADRSPAVANPSSERNDRIEITLLRTNF